MERIFDKLMLVSYDNDNLEHRKFKNELLNDEEFRRYFGDMFIKNADDIFQKTDEIELKKAYLVLDNTEIVGMIRIFNYHESGTVTVQYAVSPKFRRQGYGKLILKELTDFLIKNGIKCIKGEINSSNIGSIKIAESLGFKKDESEYRLRR